MSEFKGPENITETHAAPGEPPAGRPPIQISEAVRVELVKLDLEPGDTLAVIGGPWESIDDLAEVADTVAFILDRPDVSVIALPRGTEILKLTKGDG